MLSINYEQKYLKYKNKYTELKKQQGGHPTLDICAFFFTDKQLEDFHKTHYKEKTTKSFISYESNEIMKDFDDLMQIKSIHRKCYYLSNKHDKLQIALTDREDATKNTRNEFNNGTIDTFVESKTVYLDLKLNHKWTQSTGMFSRPNLRDFEEGKPKLDILSAFNTIKSHMNSKDLRSLIPTHVVVIEFRTGRKDLILKIAKIDDLKDITNSELMKGTYPTSTIQYDTKIDRAITEIKRTDILCDNNKIIAIILGNEIDTSSGKKVERTNDQKIQKLLEFFGVSIKK